MKKLIAVLCVLVVAAVVALGVVVSNRNDLQAKLNAANTTAADDVTRLQNEAETAAKELEDVKAQAAAAAESAAAELEKVKTDAATAAESAAAELEKVKTDAAAALESAKAEAETKLADAAKQFEDFKAEAATAAENAAAELEKVKTEAAAALESAKAEAETKLADAAKQLEDYKAQAAAELEAVKSDDAVASLTEQLENVKAEAETKLADAAKQLEDYKAEAEAKLADVTKQFEDYKAEAETKLADAAKELEDLKNQAVEAVTNTVENVEEAVTDAVEDVKEEAQETAENVEEAVTEAVEEVKEEAQETAEAVEEAVTETAQAVVMSYADYVAAELESEVTVETYVQDKQGWWKDQNTGKEQATIYCQSEDGAYFLYNMPISQEDYDALVPGTKIRVTGYKSEWAGEVEIIDATYEVIEGEAFIATPEDVTALLGTDELVNYQNRLVAFKGMTVEAKKDAAGNDAAFLYNWDGSGSAGSNNDLYFDVSLNGAVYTFTVESYLRGEDSDVYKAVTELKIGDVIDLEGYLYWYNGVNPHIISVKAAE